MANKEPSTSDLSSSMNMGMDSMAIFDTSGLMELKTFVTSVGSSSNLENFQIRMQQLRPMELKSAQAFIDRGITEKFIWPGKNETAEAMLTRKKENRKRLDAANKQKARDEE